MLVMFDYLREFTLLSVAARMLLAVVCGGFIGLEREYKHRPAGFRTHILICIGAAMTSLTSQFLLFEMGYYTDMTRLGAQVVAGVGFIGAGTIIVTHKHQVKGLTTAAGLWVSAILGLALGAGFYEAGILSAILILVAELYFSKVEFRLLANAHDIMLFVEYNDRGCIEQLFSRFQELDVKVLSAETLEHADVEGESGAVMLSLRLSPKTTEEQIVQEIQAVSGVFAVDVL